MNNSYLALCDFNPQVYGQYEDLKSMSAPELETHFLTYGISEGRVYSTVQNRSDFLASVNKNGRMLEIGPLDNPQLDHRSPNYYSVDVFSKAQLLKNYANDPNVNKSRIIEPSYIIVNNDYSKINERFDCIFSSHNIEHMPCVVTFLTNLQSLLTANGSIYLIVPDKRFCFDHFKNASDIYDILQAFAEKNARPKFSDVLRNITQVTHNDSTRHWNGDHGSTNFEENLRRQYKSLQATYRTGQYIDAHVNFFTPESFLKIIELLNDLQLIKLKIKRLYHTVRNGIEFYVELKKG